MNLLIFCFSRVEGLGVAGWDCGKLALKRFEEFHQAMTKFSTTETFLLLNIQ
jgi:hypothetical protein